MAWIGTSHGIFRLHDSDQYCGSFLTIEDAAEILEVTTDTLHILPTRLMEGSTFISELELHRAWGSGKIQSPQKPQEGNAKRSLDELIVRKLLQITLPDTRVECQVPFGRKRVDLSFTHQGKVIFVEFVGPSHFIPEYQREPTSPLARKKEVEDHFGAECVIWPFWIQRCARNIYAIIDKKTRGLASVWSTKAFFGDFVFPKSAQIIVELSDQFNSSNTDGLAYMYGNTHTNKPVHPIVEAIRSGKKDKSQLIPRGNDKPETFWLPQEIR
jgi:hypothetical protein